MDLHGRIKYIDGLRGVAVLSVLLYHFWKAYPAQHYTAWQALGLNAGRHGVELFFVLSGFCLSYPTLAMLHARGSAGFDVVKFAARRFVRIIPPYYAAIAFCLVITTVWGGSHFTARDVLRQGLFLDRGTALINASFWTLPIEFRWYFLFPVALLVAARWPRLFWLALVLLPLTWAMNIANDDLIYLPGFLLGIIAADISLKRSVFARFATFALVPLALGAFAIDAKLGPLGGFNPLWLAVSFCAVVAIGEYTIARQVFSTKSLVAVGIASYSIYLVHQPIIEALQRHGFSPIVAVGAALAGGFAFWACAERPFVYTNARYRAIDFVHRLLEHGITRVGLGVTSFSLHRAPAVYQSVLDLERTA